MTPSLATGLPISAQRGVQDPGVVLAKLPSTGTSPDALHETFTGRVYDAGRRFVTEMPIRIKTLGHQMAARVSHPIATGTTTKPSLSPLTALTLPLLAGCGDGGEAVSGALATGALIYMLSSSVSFRAFGMLLHDLHTTLLDGMFNTKYEDVPFSHDQNNKPTENYKGLHAAIFYLSNLANFAAYSALYYTAGNESVMTNPFLPVAIATTMLSFLGAPVATLAAEALDKNRERLSAWFHDVQGKAIAAKTAEREKLAKFSSHEDIPNLNNLLHSDPEVREALLHNIHVTTGPQFLPTLDASQLASLGRVIDGIIPKLARAEAPVQIDFLHGIEGLIKNRPESDPLPLVLNTATLLQANEDSSREAALRLHRMAFQMMKPERRATYLEFLAAKLAATKTGPQNAVAPRQWIDAIENIMPFLTSAERAAAAKKFTEIAKSGSGWLEGFERLLPYLDGQSEAALFGATVADIARIAAQSSNALPADYFSGDAADRDENALMAAVFPKLFAPENLENWPRYTSDLEINFHLKDSGFKVKFLKALLEGIKNPLSSTRTKTVWAVLQLVDKWKLKDTSLAKITSALSAIAAQESDESAALAAAEILSKLPGQKIKEPARDGAAATVTEAASIKQPT